MRFSLRALMLLATVLVCGPAAVRAQDGSAVLPGLAEDAQSEVKQIRFAGNKTTQEKVMLRELPFTVGQSADAGLVERGRQAILDLGLFKSVQAEVHAEDDGLIVTYTVSEKIYLLPLPRVDANSDGQYAYGAQLRWNNLFGLNQTLRATVLRRQTQRQGIGQETQAFASYFAPFVRDSRWGIGTGGGYLTRPVAFGNSSYDESFVNFSVLASRFLDPTRGSQGWFMGTGLLWERQDTSGLVAPYGMATAPVFSFGYRDLRYKVYDEEGVLFNARTAAAVRGVASDYNYAILTASAIRYLHVGDRPYQTLHLIADGGLRWEGPPGNKAFGIGGASSLRGYMSRVREGDAYYHLGLEFARPIFKPWLRVAVIGEVGDVVAQPSRIRDTDPLASIGFGLRLRFPAFVDFEVEAGIAVPLNGGNGLRFFAGKV